jgi:plasmid maintenance system antidote protein VapI
MSIKKIAEKALPFLFSKLTLIWDSLTPEEKDALIQSGQIGQILKEELLNGETAVINAVAAKTGLTPEEVSTTLIALAKTMGYNVETVQQFIDALQSKIDTGLQDKEWEALWETVSGTLMSLASGNPVNWIGLIAAIGKFVYDTFIKR